MTKQRKLIYDIICGSCEHLTAEEIYTEAKKALPSLAFGTVYRNLGILTEEGLIRKVPVSEEKCRYDKNISPHEHLCCRKCGKLADLPELHLKEYILENFGIQIEEIRLSLYYTCPQCK